MWEAFLNLDGNILLWIQEYVRNDVLTPLMKFLTHLGDSGKIWIILALLFLIFRQTRKTGILMGFSLLGSLLINNMILKNLVGRVRPYEVVEGLHRIIGAQSDLSFPSGHAGASFAAAMVIWYTCPKKYAVPAVALAVLISVSRLYVGVHYPTDIVCGAAIGTLIAWSVCRIYQMVCRQQEESRQG